MTTQRLRLPRRGWPASLACLLLAACVGSGASTASSGPPANPGVRPAVDARIEDLERRTFRFFWETTNPKNGLVPDRYPTPSFASVAAVGFGLTAYPIGVERGYVTRVEARARVLATLRFFRDAPQGASPAGMTGYHGFYYHFLDMDAGVRNSTKVELSTVDTALFIAGVLLCEGYFDRPDAAEVEIRQIADELYRRVDWAWASTPGGAVALGWTPESGFHPMHWRGYNEGMIIYLLGLGSPTFPLPAGAWRQWTSGYERSWATSYGQSFLTFPPLFGHQFSHVWVDFRGVRDEFMRAHDLDYFENSRRATYAQQAYAIDNPMHWKDYGPRVFGISAADGPAKLTVPDGPVLRVFRRYAARGPGGATTYDDGTLSPSALASSVVFAPEIVLPALDEIFSRYGTYVYSTYGFLDAFDPSFDYDVPVPVGVRVKGVGWFDGDYLGIDSGSTIAMLENYRSELIWRVLRRSPYLRRGLERAGFTGGWLDLPP
jgi:hypothetical protein